MFFLFFTLNCVDYQRKFLKMLFRPKYACHLTLFFQSPLCLICALHMAHVWLKSRGMISVLCYWFMCDFVKQMEPDKCKSIILYSRKGKSHHLSYWLGSKSPSRAFQLNPRRQGFLPRWAPYKLYPTNASFTSFQVHITNFIVWDLYFHLFCFSTYYNSLINVSWDVIKIFYSTIQLH